MNQFFESPLTNMNPEPNVQDNVNSTNNSQVSLSNHDVSHAQQIIKEWLTIDDEIEKLNKALRERKKKRKNFRNLLLNL